RTRAANKISLIEQMGEEGIEFILHARLEAGEHGDQQDREGQDPGTGKGVGIETSAFAQGIGVEVLNKVDKYSLVLRSS
ncbi:MAG: hypothetical protein ACFCUG_00225, partial [Thiotrichales bacterium]